MNLYRSPNKYFVKQPSKFTSTSISKSIASRRQIYLYLLWCCLDYSHKSIQIGITLCRRVLQTQYIKNLKSLLDINNIKYSLKKTRSNKIILQNFYWFIQNSTQIKFYQRICYFLLNCNAIFLNVKNERIVE